MKSQSLQDAIKAQALRKEKARDKQGWKEPYVKKYEITADDLAKSPKRYQTPTAAPPLYASAQPAVNNQELAILKKMLKGMEIELLQQRADITTLQKENLEIRKALRNSQPATDGSISFLSSPPPITVSPKKINPLASLDPHKAEDLVVHQRLDKALRHFMKTKEGLYDTKYLSIREEKGGSVVCFKQKIYIPQTLREMTIQHYKKEYSTDSNALAALRKNCCWPDLDQDFFGHKQ